ncbi:hypothetical protein GMDG_08459 [Pseudogymnoascus destructans 20631-21]|uniref:Uncharacterized protein n=1 Tax=Pseudogymnoascus destructans (strain ATCC MYA-4855 / 20631-21) TaxID=658429 RepID=L8G414_PSED2|nr:hypothetical protein GMDG_08459 [Pseudogymnoascus destructans 20631-21]
MACFQHLYFRCISPYCNGVPPLQYMWYIKRVTRIPGEPEYCSLFGSVGCSASVTVHHYTYPSPFSTSTRIGFSRLLPRLGVSYFSLIPIYGCVALMWRESRQAVMEL